MSPSPLSEEQKDSLREIHQSLLSDDPTGVLLKDGQILADHFRTNLPDLDDVTMGRVLLHVAAFLSALADHSDCGTVSMVSAQMTSAGVDLTSLEWGQR